MMEQALDISLIVNGSAVIRRIPARQHLIDFLREELGLTGSHVGCEHGVCGACTVRVDGTIVRKILRSASAATKLKAIVRAGEVTGVGVIAECVEDAAILAHLKLLKVGYAQGFAVGRPAPIGELFKS